MKKISTADLKDREVINLCGGEKLGYPCEFEINLDDGKITAIIIENNGTSLFGKKQEYLIPCYQLNEFANVHYFHQYIPLEFHLPMKRICKNSNAK